MAKNELWADEIKVTFQTSMGSFDAVLFAGKVPNTVANFVGLAMGTKEWKDPKTGQMVTRPLYDGTIFHRVIPDFMIQGGDPQGNGMGGPGYRFPDEIDPSLKHYKKGILSMANAGPNTNGSQFFVTDAPTPWLDGKHAVFGEVTSGIEVVAKIARTPKGGNDRPLTPVVLEKVTIHR
ncbi:MAG: Peptidyl-prolyl cis-trans isomerase B [Myxococcota bacterium]|nr:Peptidyl-prolyl cis-trans isomerase B [Myxococcota bacterium]